MCSVTRLQPPGWRFETWWVSTQDTDTHQVSNLQPGGCNLVTLHIYSPPLKLMQKFSITGESAGVWTDEEYQGGAGV